MRRVCWAWGLTNKIKRLRSSPLGCRVRHGATKGTEMDKTDSRYPYTYAADYLREKVGNDYDKGLMSRSAASQARSVIAVLS